VTAEQLAKPCNSEDGFICVIHGYFGYPTLEADRCHMAGAFDLGVKSGRAESAARIVELEAALLHAGRERVFEEAADEIAKLRRIADRAVEENTDRVERQARRIAELEELVRGCPAYGDHDLDCDAPLGERCTCWSGLAAEAMKGKLHDELAAAQEAAE